jgi:hypothetical protein
VPSGEASAAAARKEGRCRIKSGMTKAGVDRPRQHPLIVTPDLIRGPPSSGLVSARRWMPDQVRHDGRGRAPRPPYPLVTPDLIRGPPSSGLVWARRWMPDQVRHDDEADGPALTPPYCSHSQHRAPATATQTATITAAAALLVGFAQRCASALSSAISGGGMRRKASQIPAGTMSRSSK